MDLIGTSVGKHPSGIVLPLVLRRRLHLQGKGESVQPQFPKLSASFVSSAQLEDELEKLSRATLKVQSDIHQAEEIYYERTVYNVYKGWEGYIDSRDVRPNQQNRRMPADLRWFSGSCVNLNRHTQLQAIGTRISAEATPLQVEAAKKVAQDAAPLADLVRPLKRSVKDTTAASKKRPKEKEASDEEEKHPAKKRKKEKPEESPPKEKPEKKTKGKRAAEAPIVDSSGKTRRSKRSRK